MNSILHLSPKQLRRAADLKEKIASLEAELQQILGSEESATPKRKGRRGGWTMTAAAKAKIGAATKARWAKLKAEKAKAGKAK